jgi:hypothetical protein
MGLRGFFASWAIWVPENSPEKNHMKTPKKGGIRKPPRNHTYIFILAVSFISYLPVLLECMSMSFYTLGPDYFAAIFMPVYMKTITIKHFKK